MGTYNLKSLVKQITHFKSPDNWSCIDLILPNQSLREVSKIGVCFKRESLTFTSLQLQS